MERPNWLLDIPAEEYFAAAKDGSRMTSHKLNTFRRCPLELKQRMDGTIVEKDTASFVLGRATHCLTIEGSDKFAAEYLVSDGPINPKTDKPYGKQTKEFKNWLETQQKPIVSTADHELILKMNAAVRSHKIAAELLEEGFAEGTVRFDWMGVPFQCRLDWFNPETGDLVDLKTCNDIDKFRFDIRDFGYPFQLACYKYGIERAGYEGGIKASMIAVEKKEPYRVAVVKVTDFSINNCNEQHMAGENFDDSNDAMIREYKRAMETDVWPTRYEKPIFI